MTAPPDLVRRVEEVIPHLLDGRLRVAVGRTGGAGLCYQASVDLLRALELPDDGAEWVDLLWRTTTRGMCVPGLYPTPAIPLRLHCVALVDGWAVDLTARQYSSTLPFPYFWEALPAEVSSTPRPGQLAHPTFTGHHAPRVARVR